MKIDEALGRLARLDDGLIMRAVFYSLLAAAVVFVAVDMRDLTAMNAALPGYDPMHEGEPLLPPAVTEGVPAAPPVQPGSPREVLRKAIRFELAPGGVLLAEGAIDLGAAGRFAAEIEARGGYVKTVALNSPGGSVDDAIAMSKLIRERKLDTRVASKALCASSCPLVLAGGVRRMAEKEAIVGVHQVFNGGKERPSAEQAMFNAQATTARVARHLDEMGIASGLWIIALETAPDRLYYLNEKEMDEFRLTTPPDATAKKKG